DWLAFHSRRALDPGSTSVARMVNGGTSGGPMKSADDGSPAGTSSGGPTASGAGFGPAVDDASGSTVETSCAGAPGACARECTFGADPAGAGCPAGSCVDWFAECCAG